MNTKSVYIASMEPGSGKLMVTLGVLELVSRLVGNVGFFRPVIRSSQNRDNDIETILALYNLDMEYDDAFVFTTEEVEAMAAEGKAKELIQTIISRYKQLETKYDFIVCEGFETSGFAATFDFDVNLEIAKNLDTPFLGTINGRNKSVRQIIDAVHLAYESIKEEGVSHLATMVNRVDPSLLDQVKKKLQEHKPGDVPVYVFPEIVELSSPTVGEIKDQLGCSLVYGDTNGLMRIVRNFKVAAMTLDNYLNYIEDDALIIVPGDRVDILLGTFATFYSGAFPNISGILLSGGLIPPKNVMKLVGGFRHLPVPIISAKGDTFTTAMEASSVPSLIRHQNPRKVSLALGVFESNVDQKELEKRISITRSSIMTPIMFEYSLFEKARQEKQHIVLPEGIEDRILQAADLLLKREVVDITLLGNEAKIREKASLLGVDISNADIIDPHSSELTERFAEQLFELRKHKGITPDAALDAVQGRNYFGTMLIYNDMADGLVSGAVHTTGDTIRPALQIIKTKPGFSLVSSVFFMCLATRVLVYGDCAINPDPDAEQLAEIAISSAETAQTFGIEPIVAMLSYSTGQSGKGKDVDKVREATKIVKQRRPDLLVDGPIQYDAAIDPVVAKTKMPNSRVAGRATVFIFPDLNTGNNTYKAVQRSSGAVAIGPILQGLKKPVNDLSRGCLVADIINTVAITAIQAQAA